MKKGKRKREETINKKTTHTHTVLLRKLRLIKAYELKRDTDPVLSRHLRPTIRRSTRTVTLPPRPPSPPSKRHYLATIAN